MQPNLIVLETLANGTQRSFPLSQLPPLTAQHHARYTLIDTATGKTPEGLALHREGNNLKVLVDNETVLQIHDFYNEDVLAQFFSEGALNANENVLISAGSDTPAELAGAASGDGFENITVSQGIFSLAMFGLVAGGVAAEEHRQNNDEKPSVLIFAAPTTALASDSGTSDIDFITNDGTIYVTDIAEGATWEYSTDGGTTWETGVGSSFELDVNTTYAAGDIQIQQINSSGKTSSTASNATQVVIDTLAPDIIYTSAGYNTANNTLSISGLNLNDLLTDGETATTNIVGNLDWSKLQWDFGSDNTGNATFTETDISSVKVTSDTSLAIVLNSTKASTIEGTSGFDPLNVDDQIEISNGFSGDTAGNVATNDAFDSFPNDESIVVFDLIGGHSSGHSARIFNPDTAYTIYIIVDSTAANVTLSQTELWSGVNDLGNDDTINLVGSGSAIIGPKGGDPRTTIAPPHETFGYVWQSSISFSAEGILNHTGIFTRIASGTVSDSTRIFVSSSANQSFQLLGAGGAYSINAAIMTSQGLA